MLLGQGPGPELCHSLPHLGPPVSRPSPAFAGRCCPSFKWGGGLDLALGKHSGGAATALGGQSVNQQGRLACPPVLARGVCLPSACEDGRVTQTPTAHLPPAAPRPVLSRWRPPRVVTGPSLNSLSGAETVRPQVLPSAGRRRNDARSSGSGGLPECQRPHPGSWNTHGSAPGTPATPPWGTLTLAQAAPTATATPPATF